MKSIISFVAVAALSCVTSAIAQESPSPATEEKASATVEETATVRPTPESKPAATPEEKAAAAKKEEPAAQKKETTATAAPKKGASPAAAATPAKKVNVEAALKDNENRWEAAIARHDSATIELMVASDFTGVSSKGKFQNRRGLLGEMKGDKDTYTSAKIEKLDVHPYGGNVAVVVGRAREKGTAKDGKAFDRTYLFTDTWMERGGQWQCVASEVMELPRR